MTESAIEKKFVREIKKMGGKAFKFVSPGHAGVPDRLVLLPGGTVLFTELKTETGRLSPIQKHAINEMEKLGADVRVVYGNEGVTAALARIKRELFGEEEDKNEND